MIMLKCPLYKIVAKNTEKNSKTKFNKSISFFIGIKFVSKKHHSKQYNLKRYALDLNSKRW